MKKTILYIIFLLTILSSYSQVSIVREYSILRNHQLEPFCLGDSVFSSLRPYLKRNSDAIYSDSLARKIKPGFSSYPIYSAYYFQDASNIRTFWDLISLGGGLNYSRTEKLGVSYQLVGMLVDLPDFMKSNKWDIPVYNNLGLASRVQNNVFFENDFHLIYSPYSGINIDLAYSKNFVGEGYRSLLLSDYSAAYPYLKIDARFLNLKYSCIWAVHSNLENYEIEVVKRNYKFTAFHYLDIKLGKRLNVGIFETGVGNDKDFFSFEYLNPIIFLGPMVFSSGSDDKMIIGINLKYTLKKRTSLYAQFFMEDLLESKIFDDIKYVFNKKNTEEYGWYANKWGLQLGVKSYDVFKIRNLNMFTELNLLRPYAYSHSDPNLSYSHGGLALAHPLGANFIESVSGLGYAYDNFLFDFKFMYARQGVDTASNHNYGQDIFKSNSVNSEPGKAYKINPYFNVITQGVRSDIFSTKLDVGYVYCRKNNIVISLGVASRVCLVDRRAIYSNMVYIGIKSNMPILEMTY